MSFTNGISSELLLYGNKTGIVRKEEKVQQEVQWIYGKTVKTSFIVRKKCLSFVESRKWEKLQR